MTTVETTQPLLAIRGLRTYFRTDDGIIRAVDGVDLEVMPRQTLGIVGESGCGKSITALSIMGLVTRPGRVVAGRILFDGRDLLELSPEEMEDVRGNDIAMIFQEPMTSLNPVFRVGDQVAEAIQRHLGYDAERARQRVIELFTMVGIPSPEKRIDDYPHQLSGGMRQRVMIAMALSCNPRLLIADEPTTALDVTIQAQILELMKQLTESQGMSMIMITHDLGVIAEVAETVAVMYAGKVVERAPVEEIFSAPKHPYTQGLLASIPSPDKTGRRLDVIPGVVPHPLNLPPGCTFAPRCRHRFELCDTAFPALRPIAPGHDVACYLYHDEPEKGRAASTGSASTTSLPTEPASEAAAGGVAAAAGETAT